MGEVRVMGVDPAFRNTGWVHMQLGDSSERIQAVGLVRTKKTDKKMRILESDDRHRCCNEIAMALNSAIDVFVPHYICAEALVGSKGAAAATMQGMAWGVLSAITAVRKIPVFTVSPQGMKKALCGSKSASKEDIENAVKARYPNAAGIVGSINPPGAREHVYDAIGVVIACLGLPEIMALKRQFYLKE